MSERLLDTSAADIALESDTETLSEILLKANLASAQHNGQPTWPFTDTALEHLERDIQAGEVYCLRDNHSTPYAAVAISTTDKKNLWPSELKHTEAVYFSKLMKNPSATSHGVMNTLFQQIIALAKENDITTIRCDAVADNDKLLAYYKRLGFEFSGRAPYPYLGDTRYAQLLETTCEILEQLVGTRV